MVKRLRLELGDRSFELRVEPIGEGEFRVSLEGREYNLRLMRRKGGLIEATVNGEPVEAYIEEKGEILMVHLTGRKLLLRRSLKAAPTGAQAPKGREANLITSPMPGRVLKLLVGHEDVVEKDSPIMILESMKMQATIKADRSGKVKRLHVQEGSSVKGGDPLITLEPI